MLVSAAGLLGRSGCLTGAGSWTAAGVARMWRRLAGLFCAATRDARPCYTHHQRYQRLVRSEGVPGRVEQERLRLPRAVPELHAAWLPCLTLMSRSSLC